MTDATPRPPIDLVVAEEEFGSLELFGKLLRSFLEDVGEAVPGLATLHPEALRSEAHKIKGGALNLTAEDLGRAAAALQEAADSDEDGNIPEALRAFKAEVERLRAYAENDPRLR